MPNLARRCAHWWDRLQAEIALRRHNQDNRRGIVDPTAQRFFVIDDVLPDRVFDRLVARCRVERRWVRSETSWRRGGAIGGHELDLLMGKDLAHLNSDEFILELRRRTGLNDLAYVPRIDTNRLSLLSYRGAGDGIDWHVDGSIYLGPRWAGILTLVEDTFDAEAKLELRPNGELVSLPASAAPNSLVLFQGDHVRHRARPLVEGEERIALSLLLSTWPVRTLNPFLRRYQSRVNLTFYGNPDP